MPNNRVEVKFEYLISKKSDNGKAFGWLQDNLGSACSDAITDVVRFVYLPIALATDGATRTEVETLVKKASEFLNEKMMAALGSCYTLESNVKVTSNGSSLKLKFFHRFSRKSDNGKAFGWLQDNLGSACLDAITNVVRFVYLPIALAAEGATRTEVETEINQATEFLNEKMMAALGACCEQIGSPKNGQDSYPTEQLQAIKDSPKNKESPGLLPSNKSTPATFKNAHPFKVLLGETENFNSSTGANTLKSAAIAPMDDFLELDEDKFMED